MPNSLLSQANRFAAGAVLACAVTLFTAHYAVSAQNNPDRIMEDPVVRNFIGPGGLGAQHPDAPPETSQFGQLVGIWRADQEILTRNGEWAAQPSAIWIWKYILGGYATQDLWYQNKANLPAYLGISGRDYLLTGIRVFDPGKNRWQIGWASNAAGKTPGNTAGSFDAQMVNGELIMSGPPIKAEQGEVLQRVIFSEFSSDRFKWRSEFSQDGGRTWVAVMRLNAVRLK